MCFHCHETSLYHTTNTLKGHRAKKSRREEQSHLLLHRTNWPGIYRSWRRRARGLGRRTLTATCTNTHRARAVANSNDDAFTTSYVPFMFSPELMPPILAFAVIFSTHRNAQRKDAACCYAFSVVCLSVCLFVTTVSPTKTDERIQQTHHYHHLLNVSFPHSVS